MNDIKCKADFDWLIDMAIEDTANWVGYANTTLEFALDELRFDQVREMVGAEEINDPDAPLLYFWYRKHVFYRGAR